MNAADKIAAAVNEWFQAESTPERQQNMRRTSLILDLQDLFAERRALAELHAEFADAHGDDASSNDVVQLLDDFLTKRGFPTVLYA